MTNKLSFDDTFEHLFNVTKSSRFLKKEGLGNEVPFFICPYDKSRSLELDDSVEALKRKLRTDCQVEAIIINLYDICIEILKKEGVFEALIDNESSIDKDDLLDTLQAMLNPSKSLIHYINKNLHENTFDLVFMTGVGEVFPYIRSHTVLNNLQSSIEDNPMIMFFPGEYSYSKSTGRSLDLFEQTPGNRYYRAFNILDYQVL